MDHKKTKKKSKNPHKICMPIILEHYPRDENYLFPKTKYTIQSNSNNVNSQSSSSNISPEISSYINECPGGSSCVNLMKIQSLLIQIQKLKLIVEETNKLNEFFVYNLNQKDNMYRTLLQENNSIKNGRLTSKDKFPYSPKNIRSKQLTPLFSPKVEKVKKKLNISPLNITVNSKKVDQKHHIPQSSSQIISLFRSEQKNKKHITSILNSNYYDDIMQLSNKTSKHKLQSAAISYLSMTIEKLKQIGDENMKNIKSLTHSEDYFVSILRSESKEFLISFNENLRNLTKEHKQIINLIIRIKQFLTSTLELVDTLFTSNSPETFLENTCKLLDCERTMLYLNDPITDMLQVFSGGNIVKPPTKIPKARGIIGTVLSKGEKIKIDDTKQDTRFKKEDESGDKNYKIRNLICYPLIDRHGSTFGAIEALNKKDKFFNTDDEELMNVFTKLGSVVLSNKTFNDNNVRQISRLEKIIKYSNDIRGIGNRNRLMEKTEYVLSSVFASGHSQFIFVIKGELIHYNKKFPNVENIGVINLVIKKKECHGCCRAKRCKYYNSLVDIEASESLITYPIMYNDECIAVAQVSLTEKISEITLKPKEQEMQLLTLIASCVIEWYLDNKENPTTSSVDDDS